MHHNKDYHTFLLFLFCLATTLASIATGLVFYLNPPPELEQPPTIATIILYSVAAGLYAWIGIDRIIYLNSRKYQENSQYEQRQGIYPSPINLHLKAIKLLSYIFHGLVVAAVFFLVKGFAPTIIQHLIQSLKSCQ